MKELLRVTDVFFILIGAIYGFMRILLLKFIKLYY